MSQSLICSMTHISNIICKVVLVFVLLASIRYYIICRFPVISILPGVTDYHILSKHYLAVNLLPLFSSHIPVAYTQKSDVPLNRTLPDLILSQWEIICVF